MQTKITYFSTPHPIKKEKLLEYIDSSFQPIKVLKNDKRSLVFMVEAGGVKYVVKNPRDKNRRLWIRFLTLFRKSEAAMALTSMEILLSLGIPTTKPIALFEKNRFGMVVEGWMVYEYFEASPIETSDIKKSYELLCNLHQSGFLHGNPQEQNFLRFNDAIATIDAKLSKTQANGVDTWIEKIKFANSFIRPSDREVARALIDKTDMGYKKALDKMALVKILKRPKYWFKGLLQAQPSK